MLNDHSHNLKREDENYDESYNRYKQKRFNKVNRETLNKLKVVAENQLKSNHILKACSLFEKALKISGKLYGMDSKDLSDYFNGFIQAMNSKALKLLKENKINLAFQILLKCEDLFKKDRYPFETSLAVLTMNHLACCYRKIGHPKKSLKILEEATELIFKKNLKKHKGLTYMNKSSILNFLGNHEKALENARTANRCFYKEIQNINLNQPDMDFFKEFQEVMRLLIMSLYNIATEYEFCKKYGESTKESTKALGYIKTFLVENPANAALAKKLRILMAKVKKKNKKILRKEKERISFRKRGYDFNYDMRDTAEDKTIYTGKYQQSRMNSAIHQRKKRIKVQTSIPKSNFKKLKKEEQQRKLDLEVFQFMTKEHFKKLERIKEALEEEEYTKIKEIKINQTAKAINNPKARRKGGIFSPEIQRNKKSFHSSRGPDNLSSSINHSENLKKIIKIQSVFRMALCRSRFRIIKKKLEKDQEEKFLWRKFKILDFVDRRKSTLSKTLCVLTARLSASNEYVNFIAKPMAKHSSLPDRSYKHEFEIRELNDYLDSTIEDYESTRKMKYQEGFSKKIKEIKEFSEKFSDTLMVEDERLCFNEREKMKIVIQIFGNSLLENDPLIDNNLDQDENSLFKEMSSESDDNNFKGNNSLENILDETATLIQKNYRGFSTRKKFKLIMAKNSINLLIREVEQDGEYLIFVLMKRFNTGKVTAYCKNISIDEHFEPIEISMKKMEPEKIFRNIFFDLDNNEIYFNDFIDQKIDTKAGTRDKKRKVHEEEKSKVNLLIDKKVREREGTYSKRINRDKIRRRIIGKKTCEIKQFYVSDKSNEIHIEAYQLRRHEELKDRYINMKRVQEIFHDNRSNSQLITIANFMHLDCKIKQVKESDENGEDKFALEFKKFDDKKYSSDYNKKQVLLIKKIQNIFRRKVLKAEVLYSTDMINFKIEYFYLPKTRNIVIKIFKKEPSSKYTGSKASKIKKMEYYNNLEEDELFQKLRLKFDNIHHPKGILESEEIDKLANFIIVKKLYYDYNFSIPSFAENEIRDLLKTEKISDKRYKIYHEDFKIHPFYEKRSNRNTRSEGKNSYLSKLTDTLPKINWDDSTDDSNEEDFDGEDEEMSSNSENEGSVIVPSLYYELRTDEIQSSSGISDDRNTYGNDQISEEDSIDPSAIDNQNINDLDDQDQYKTFNRHSSMKAKIIAVAKFSRINKEKKRRKTHGSSMIQKTIKTGTHSRYSENQNNNVEDVEAISEIGTERERNNLTPGHLIPYFGQVRSANKSERSIRKKSIRYTHMNSHDSQAESSHHDQTTPHSTQRKSLIHSTKNFRIKKSQEVISKKTLFDSKSRRGSSKKDTRKSVNMKGSQKDFKISKKDNSDKMSALSGRRFSKLIRLNNSKRGSTISKKTSVKEDSRDFSHNGETLFFMKKKNKKTKFARNRPIVIHKKPKAQLT